jgi:hypothetical protein
MRRYDDPVDVRRGRVTGMGGGPVEGPEQFVWKGRLWKVHAVLAQWVETGPWWQSSGVHAVLGGDEEPGGGAGVRTELAAEREVWRVEAARGMTLGRGVFDLVLDWTDGSWRLTRCLD